jgi:transposase
VVVINSLAARRFIQALLVQDKTDRLDALHLAHIAEYARAKLTLWEEPPDIYEELRQRLDLRDALVSMRSRQLNRNHAVKGRLHIDAVDQQRRDVKKYLDRQAKSLEKEMKRLLLPHPDWGENARYLYSIPGFGIYMVTALMVHTVNFTAIENADQLAAFVGVVPRKHESGQSGRAHIRYSSKPRFRDALYMSTMSAVRFNPIIRDYYNRLVARGKGRQKTRIACMRKLLHIACGCVRNQTMFDPDYSTSP